MECKAIKKNGEICGNNVKEEYSDTGFCGMHQNQKDTQPVAAAAETKPDDTGLPYPKRTTVDGVTEYVVEIPKKEKEKVVPKTKSVSAGVEKEVEQLKKKIKKAADNKDMKKAAKHLRKLSDMSKEFTVPGLVRPEDFAKWVEGNCRRSKKLLKKVKL